MAEEPLPTFNKMKAKGSQFDIYREPVGKRSTSAIYDVGQDLGEEGRRGQPMIKTAGVLHVDLPTPSYEGAARHPELNERGESWAVGEQGSMIHHTPSTRPHPEVFAMFVGKEAGASMPATLLGVAQNDMYQRFGSRGEMRPPSDLSPESSRMVKGLKNRGVLPPETKSRVTNSYSDVDVDRGPFELPVGTKKVTSQERRVGLKTVKSILGRNKERQSKSQETYTQLQLPGTG